ETERDDREERATQAAEEEDEEEEDAHERAHGRDAHVAVRRRHLVRLEHRPARESDLLLRKSLAHAVDRATDERERLAYGVQRSRLATRRDLHEEEASVARREIAPVPRREIER